MKKRKTIHKVLGVIFIGTGIIFYPTPIPGTTLLIIFGFVWYMGKTKTIGYLKHILSHKTFRFLKIQKIVSKI